jgi:hypothetical protein
MFLVRHAEQQQHDKPQYALLSQPPEETPLDTAIESASRAQLCHILRQLCAHSKTATELTRDCLISHPETVEASKQVTLRSILKKPGSSKTSSQQQQSTPVGLTPPSNETPPSSQVQSQGHVKRKATTQCRNCGCEYSPSNSDKPACVHHPGK